MSVKLTVVGCSPAWPNPGGAQSGYLLEGPGRLLLDCGPGVLSRLRERGAWPHVNAVVITHFHLDHWGDLVPWAFGTQFGPGRAVAPQPDLWVPAGGAEKILAVERILGAHALGERVDDAPLDRRRAAQQPAEVRPRDDHDPRGQEGRHGRRRRPVGEERDLAEEVTGAELAELAPLAPHDDDALEQDEELP